MSPRPRSFTLHIDRQTITVRAFTRDEGADLVVLLPGLGCTGESFIGAFDRPELSEFALCALDLPGHGGSDTLGPASTVDNAAEAVRLVIDQLDVERVHIVGHSMGGAVGLVAAQQLSSVASFISIEGNLIGGDCGLVSREIARQSAEEFEHGGFNDLLSMLAIPGRPDLQAWRTWLASCDRLAIHAAARSLVTWSDTGTLVKYFHSLPNKSYVHGANSDVSHLAQVLADVITYPVENAGHFPMVDHPDRLYEIIGADLRRIAVNV